MVRSKLVINRPIKLDNGSGGRAASYVKTFFTRLTTRKSLQQLQVDSESQNELKRTLGWFQLFALGIGSIIGE